MKFLIPLLLVCILAVGVTAKDEQINSAAFLGGQYDNDKGWSMTYGGAHRISGVLWAIPRLTAGSFEAAELDFAAIAGLGDFMVGVVAGPNVDWTGAESPTTYLTGGVGGLVGWEYKPLSTSIVLGAKYKFSFEGDNMYQDGWQAGLWLTKGL